MTSSMKLPDDLRRARDYLLAIVSDVPIPWEDAQEELGGIDPGELTAVLNELETTENVVYGLDRIRRSRPGDPGPADLDDVAAAVLTLDWTPGRTHRGHVREKGAWMIREVYADGLRGRFRHVDVYNAMHQVLKGRELLLRGQQHWVRAQAVTVTTRQLEVEQSAEPAVTFEQQLAADVSALPPGATDGVDDDELDDEPSEDDPPVLVARRKAWQLERALCKRYAEQCGIPRDDIEYAVLSGRIDVLDRRRRRVVEAKLDASLTSVSQAVGQADGYLYALRRFDSVAVDRAAVLLPARPSDLVLKYLEQIVQQGRLHGLVYLDGDRFVEHAFPLHVGRTTASS